MVKKIRLLLILAIILVFAVFNILYWTLPIALKYSDQLKAGYYVSYGFITLSMVLTACSILYATRRDKDGILYSIPLIYVSYAFFAAELAMGNPLGLIARVPFLLALIPQLILTIAYLLLIILALMGIVFQKGVRDRVIKKVGYISDLKLSLELTSKNCNDALLRKDIEKMAEKVRFSDPMSDDSLEDLEKQLLNLAETLKTFVSSNDLEQCKGILNKMDFILEERNAKCKNLKN